MPAPLGISAWQSLWQEEKQGGQDFGEAMRDFHTGYWGTTLMSICFLGLGALVFYHSGRELENSAAVFTQQPFEMFTVNMPSALWYVLVIAAIATMFSTCLTCLDAGPRVLKKSLEELDFRVGKGLYVSLVFLSAIGAVSLPLLLGGDMLRMVDFATTASFQTAPIFAFINYRVNYGSQLPAEHRPGTWHRILAIIGLVGLSCFAIFYILTKCGLV